MKLTITITFVITFTIAIIVVTIVIASTMTFTFTSTVTTPNLLWEMDSWANQPLASILERWNLGMEIWCIATTQRPRAAPGAQRRRRARCRLRACAWNNDNNNSDSNDSNDSNSNNDDYYYYYWYWHNFATQDFDILKTISVHLLWKSCGDLRIFVETIIFQSKMTSNYCGDLRRRRIRAKTAQTDIKILAHEIP